jgi:hypothetical protein
MGSKERDVWKLCGAIRKGKKHRREQIIESNKERKGEQDGAK